MASRLGGGERRRPLLVPLSDLSGEHLHLLEGRSIVYTTIIARIPQSLPYAARLRGNVVVILALVGILTWAVGAHLTQLFILLSVVDKWVLAER